MDSQVEIRSSVTVEQKTTTTYSEERKALGLKEERTLQEIAQEKDKQRKEAFESYLSYRKSEKKQKLLQHLRIF